MFEELRDGLQSAFKALRGKGRLTEANMRDGLGLVEQSLLEADVSFDVAKAFMARVTEEAVGERVLKMLDPSQQIVKIVYDALVELLGPVDPSLHLKKDVNVLMLCGLQGSGKTTTCGKLARLLLESDVQPMLVAADLQRPAAIEQLHTIGDQLGVPVYSEPGSKNPVAVCQNAVRQAKEEQHRVVILDTAGRLAIDEELMAELTQLDNRVQPDQVYLVVDGMTGQDAVNSAKSFNDALELDGVIMTKLDGDARGGALLSVKQVTGVPIKFIGTGEHLDSLEPFRPDGMASRILGMGDVVALVSEAQRLVDDDERQKYEEKMRSGDFTLEDFRDQMQKLTQRSGMLGRLIDFMPGMGQVKDLMEQEGAEDGISRMVAIINSMTPSERRDPKAVDTSRRVRIARGAGVEAQEVNQLVKQFEQMKPIMQAMTGKGMGGRLQALRELQEGGMLDPGSKGPRIKKGTGKRLSTKEKAIRKKLLEKQKKRKKRS